MVVSHPDVKPKIFELTINPNYAVFLPQKTAGSRTLSDAQRANLKNLAENRTKGELSKKSNRKLINAVNWLVASAKQKFVYDSSTKKKYTFRVNFITLTLPSTEQLCSDHFFKSVLLHNFVNTCKHKFGLANYVWKVETQKNGNIHAHFTTDTFIHHSALRDVWNSILRKNGLLDSYHEKFRGISLDEYTKLFEGNEKITIDQITKAFNFGVQSNWDSPNTTDVHSVKNVRNLAGYLAKYLGKSEEGRRKIKGRLWSCSYSLSYENRLKLEVPQGCDNDLLRELQHVDVVYKTIDRIDSITQQPKPIGDLYFYRQNFWGKCFKNRLLKIYLDHLQIIRNCSGVVKRTLFSDSPIVQPEFLKINISIPVFENEVQLNLAL
jgi:hypothetical protein